MFKFLEYIFPGKNRLNAAIAEMKSDLKEQSELLVSWEGRELELMSLIQENRLVKSAFEQQVSGIICSIYHEHMVAYCWKKLSGLGNIEIIVAHTKKYHFEYVKKNGRISFYVQDQFLGEFKNNDKLYLSKKRELASIRIGTGEWWPIEVDSKPVGSLVNIDQARHVNPRAFQLRSGISPEQEIVFLSMAIYQIIDRTKDMKKIPFK